MGAEADKYGWQLLLGSDRKCGLQLPGMKLWLWFMGCWKDRLLQKSNIFAAS